MSTTCKNISSQRSPLYYPSTFENTINMRLIAILAPLSFAGYCSAWTKDASGVWVANNNHWQIGNGKWPCSTTD